MILRSEFDQNGVETRGEECGPDQDCTDSAAKPEGEVHIAYAQTIRSTVWEHATGSWTDLVAVLTDHREQHTKDGLCFVPGVLRGSSRGASQIERLTLIGFDLDGGEALDSIRQKLIASRVEALIYSTYSHLSTRSTIAVAGYRKFTGQTAVEPQLVMHYLAKVKRIQPHILEKLRVCNDGSDGETIYVEHPPIEKYRVIIRLKQPFAVAELMRQGMTLDTVKELWKTVYCAVGHSIDLGFDPACADLPRAYYAPARPPGAAWVAEHMAGHPLDLDPFIAAAMPSADDEAATARTRDSNNEGYLVTDRDGCTQDLRKWEAKFRSKSRIVDIIRACAPALANALGDNTDDKQHVTCPFEHEHTNPEQGSGTFVANPGRLVDGKLIDSFTIHCCHAACSGRVRLDFLKGFIAGGHLTFADLVGEARQPHEQASHADQGVAKYVKRWAVINAGGKALFFNTEERDLSRALLAESDFERLHRNDYTVVADGPGQERTLYWAKEFKRRPPPETRFYRNGFCFKPAGNADLDSFNLYRGLYVKPSPSGSCDLFRALIFEVWAAGDTELGEWLWEYFLHMVARPGERVRTSIAIRGSFGAGKSVVFEMMRRIFADLLLVVDNQNIVLGAFNESLIGKLAVVLEEAAFAGDRSAFQKMKNLITGSTVHVNPKHRAPITVENYARVFLISNEEHFLHLESGDRRYTVIEASDAWKGTDKHQQLLDQWERGGGAERFVWEAANHEFRVIPGTQTLVINKNLETKDATAQVSQSRDPLQQAIVDLLLRGSFTSMRDGLPIASVSEFYWPMAEEAEIQSTQLQTFLRAVVNTLAPSRVEHLTSLKKIVTELERFCGSLEQRKGKRKNHLTGQWCSAPTTRVLPPRRAALDLAHANRLITQDEHDAATSALGDFANISPESAPRPSFRHGAL